MKALKYARECVCSPDVPQFVKIQCKIFIDIAEGRSEKYMIDDELLSKIEKLLKILNMPKGLKQGESLYDCSMGYQWLIYSSLCVTYRDNPGKRVYENYILEISRKNFKTFTIATVFIILMLIEPQNSQFYSVAPDGALSREIKRAIEEILHASPLILEYQEKPRWKMLRDEIRFLLKNNKYQPLAFSTSRMDGRMPTAFICDETGALPDVYPIQAMRSGALNLKNKLGFIISTKYPNSNNPFETEVDYAKKVLIGEIEDPNTFALLYEPDVNDDISWMENDTILKQANPVALEIPEIWEELLKLRQRAIDVPSARENFLTKHCNIIYQSEAESFIDINLLKKCSGSVDFTGRNVYVGFDLSQTSDNTAVSIVGLDDDGETLLLDSFCFIPANKTQEKSKTEKIDYQHLPKIYPCGSNVIDYQYVEQFIRSIEKDFNCKICGIGYDRWNALATAESLSEDYITIEVSQRALTLHGPTKTLREKILEGKVKYDSSPLFEHNVESAKINYDVNMNMFVNKKKSRGGKIDMLAATINALFVLQEMEKETDFIVQL